MHQVTESDPLQLPHSIASWYPVSTPTALPHLPHQGVSRSMGILLELDLSLSRLNCRNLISALSTNLSSSSLSNDIFIPKYYISLFHIVQKHFCVPYCSRSISLGAMEVCRPQDNTWGYSELGTHVEVWRVKTHSLDVQSGKLAPSVSLLCHDSV